jgi:hypothetical protein
MVLLAAPLANKEYRQQAFEHRRQICSELNDNHKWSFGVVVELFGLLCLVDDTPLPAKIVDVPVVFRLDFEAALCQPPQLSESCELPSPLFKSSAPALRLVQVHSFLCSMLKNELSDVEIAASISSGSYSGPIWKVP